MSLLSEFDKLVGTDFAGKKAGNQIKESTEAATNLQVDAQREQLDYLKERERLPNQFRDQALTGIGAELSTLEGGDPIASAKNSPLYAALMGGRAAGEGSILRNASATGGLRGDNANMALSDYNTNLENTALLSAYQNNQNRTANLRGNILGLPNNNNNIAGTIGGIGGTLAQGQIASAQGQIAARNMGINQLMGAAQTAGSAYLAFSDIRLKDSIEYIGEENGHSWYEWTWNKLAKSLGLSGKSHGVMAHEVFETHPDSIGVCDGFVTVDYSRLDIELEGV